MIFNSNSNNLKKKCNQHAFAGTNIILLIILSLVMLKLINKFYHRAFG